MNNIDERIVEMQFNNKQFESGIKTSLNSLDNLKKGLNLDEASRSLSNLDRVGKSFSLAGIADGVDSIRSKFSALGIIGITTLQNITNAAINAGKRIVSSLTIEPIKEGLSEYETKMDAIQTIMTNTESKGTKLKDVNAALNELNQYSDQTIYNFAQMTDNIGKMTAAGLGLKDSVTVVKGLANTAAGFGVDATRMAGATYQMSQALAAGTVQLQDWRSMEQAGMGGEKIRNALIATAKSMGKVVDAGKPFRETLKQGWLTTDVFVKTMEKMANDKALTDAATNVTSLTKLFGVMKESVGSGWAQSWENIFGNKEQSTKLFTNLNNAFSSLIKPSTDARNAMLSFWNANGGRDAIIQGLSNSFKVLQTVLKPIGEAFREIFPAVTGKQLVEFSKAFKDLTTRFKIGDETLKNIKSTFKGLFALFDIGKQALVAIGKGLGKLASDLNPTGKSLLSFTGSMGEFLVSLDKAIQSSNIFGITIEKIGNFITLVANGIKFSVDLMGSAFDALRGADTSGLDDFSKRLQDGFAPFTKMGEIVEKVISKMAARLQKVAPIFYKLSEKIGGAFKKLQERIVTALDNSEFDSVFDLVNGGLFAGILVGLKKFIDSLTSLTDKAGNPFGGITGILSGVKGCLEGFQKDLKANALLKIAISIGILALALIGLASIDSKKLTSSLAAMTAMFADLMGSMAIFEKITSGTGFKSMGKVTIAMMGLSVAILILSSAMTKLAKLDWNGIAKGLTGVAGLTATLVGASKLMESNSKRLMRGALGFVVFGAAINVLASAVERLGKLNLSALAKGLAGVGVIMGELVLFMKTTDLTGMAISKTAGILVLAMAIGLLASTVEKFSKMDPENLMKGLLALGVVLTEIFAFTRLTGDSKLLISTAIALTILGVAINIFALAIEKMGSLSWEQIGKGLLTMAVSLGLIIATVKLLPEKNMLLTGLGLIGIATALVILSKALGNMGSMSWMEIAKGLITLAGSLAIIVIAMQFMPNALPGAAALLIISVALKVLSGVLLTFGKMSLIEIGKGLLMLAGVFAVIGVAGLLLAPILPAIIGLAAAIALVGVACLAVGAGMLMFSAGLAALAVSGAAGGAALVAVITGIVGLIPYVLKTLATGLIEFARVIGEGAPVIAEAVGKIVLAITQVIAVEAPKIMQSVVTFLSAMLDAIVQMIPKMVDSGMKLILGVLKGISDNIAKVTAEGIEVILQFIKGIISKLPAIIDTSFKVIISFINGLADAINNNHKALYEAVRKLMNAIINAIVDFIPSLVGIGGDIIKGLIRGITSMGTAVKNAIKGIANGAVNGLKQLLGIHSPSKVFGEIGQYSMLGFIAGIKKLAGAVNTEAGNVGNSAMDSLRNAMANVTDAVNVNPNMTPTIRPVVDMTDVENGISSTFGRVRGVTISTDNIRVPSINMRSNSNGELQNTIAVPSDTQNIKTNPKPVVLQLMLQNGRAIAEYVVDDIDNLIGSKNIISQRAVGK